ncbi:Mus7/MMS22 family-domain-containing protein [Lophiotrema nucula]|uniref:Mus7/MMS22 family-domain-containing protein n=1 Tax=Lophiotrema nucula TaxID=690887 RepID=A0A6A5YE41_9PLEO|nr:Mus7/MMS22 family-domain-containing protein [Lophiotrema nucula]
MSRWRQKGFVQDSDDEEEDLETLSTNSTKHSQHTEIERVASPIPSIEQPTQLVTSYSQSSEILGAPVVDYHASPQAGSLRKGNAQARPTVSPFTQTARSERETESPDPLQRSLSPPNLSKAQRAHNANGDAPRNPFQLELLSQSTLSDDALSEPPPDIEAEVVFASPRRQAGVQVIIPLSTAVENLTERQRASRSLRERKPIQLNPYLIEGERYRQEWRIRGLKPIARPKTPPRKVTYEGDETQEQEFAPQDDSPPASPPVFSWATPTVRKTRPDKQYRGSASRSATSSTRRLPHVTRGPSADAPLARPTAIKRRKLHHSSTQPASSTTTDPLNRHVNPDILNTDDIWALPGSPPYSSSPRLNATDPAIRRLDLGPAWPSNLPTPSNSSSVQDGHQADERPHSGAGEEPTTAGRSPGRRFRPIPVISDSSSSESGSSDEESGESENEVQRVGKRIKGVLPASWLRLDKQTQEKRKLQARQRLNEPLSPERVEAQRGVAQRVSGSRHTPRRTQTSRDRTQDLVVISDDSDNEGEVPPRSDTNDFRTSAKAAADMAALYDQRYADDDGDDMENDRLHLFTLGGGTRSRKRQSKLTDVFGKAKRQTVLNEPISIGRAGSGKAAQRSHGQKKRLSSGRKGYRAPALSILDVIRSPSLRTQRPPQFIRLAVRSARRRPDKGRQSPRNKHIRLHTAGDTEDASLMLRRWEQGELKPRSTPKQTNNQPDLRPPLADRTNNQQSRSSSAPKAHLKSVFERTTSSISAIEAQQPTTTAFPLPSNPEARPTYGLATIIRTPREALRRGSTSFRAGQIEGPEAVFGKSYERFAFNRNLRRVDEQFELQNIEKRTLRNPQLAKFLTDDDAVLPPLPSAQEVGDFASSLPNSRPPQPKRRLIRKKRARRVDVETREYRQPSEPPLPDIVSEIAAVLPEEPEQPALQGLGPFGTRYPTTFDVTPLVVGTYFQSSTFIGNEELQRALATDKRNLDLLAGHCTIRFGSSKIECGSWDDLTFSRIEDLLNATWSLVNEDEVDEAPTLGVSIRPLRDSAKIFRSLISYFAIHLSFSDPIDRREFASRMKQLLRSMFEKVVQHQVAIRGSSGNIEHHQYLRPMTYLLVLNMQVRNIAQHSSVEHSVVSDVNKSITDISTTIVNHLVRQESYNLGIFLEKNKRHKERENGIQEDDVTVECLVALPHVLEHAAIPGNGFWDLVSRELSVGIGSMAQIHSFDSVWANAFTLLPFTEFDSSGILKVNRRSATANDNWTFVRDLLRRVFALYPATAKMRGSTSNEYIRATLTRCHTLIHYWHWRKCDSMLNIVFDFFAKNGLRQLPRENCKGSPRFLERLAQNPSLDVDQADGAFHIFLKCLALGLLTMKNIYPEKKIRSVVLRCTPNHGRNYPKDQSLEKEHLTALRNHLDLLCTLYWASPVVCRPKVELLQGLVQHGTSHREACKQHVRAWANLAAFQLSTSEPIESARPLAEWFKEMTRQTLRQYWLAKIEAEENFKAMQADGTTLSSTHMVQQNVTANQGQVIETLRDCVSGMHRATKQSLSSESAKIFLMESGVVELLELPHIEDARLSNVIRETLDILKAYASLRRGPQIEETSQQGSEESQEYGEVPDFDLAVFEQGTAQEKSLDFMEMPLWHLLSNAFGAEQIPDDKFLMDCIDTWALIAVSQVSSGDRSWDYYFGSFSKVSWQQLRKTDQTRRFGPYFMSALLTCDSAAYREHQHDYLSALFVSLVERESMLRFQHCLLHAITRTDSSNPLMRNLPFYQDERTRQLDITPDTLRARRLSLLSSLLSNMREHVYTLMQDDPTRLDDVKRGYAAVLNDMMTAMKNNYQQLRQGSIITGAYVDFVHRIVTFLQQYASDICPVNAFFTDDATFPLPATDPKYVIGRLRGYAGKLSKPGVAKQLSVFIQTVAQQATLDNQQPYLVQQLCTAVQADGLDTSETYVLRSILLQSIFPAYIEAALSSAAGLVIAKPILQSLVSIIKNMFFDIRVMDPSNVRSMCDTISCITLALVRSTERLVDTLAHLAEPYTRQAVALSLNVMSVMLPLMDYISHRALDSASKLPIVTYFEEFSVFAADVIRDREPHSVPMYSGPTTPTALPHPDVLAFSSKDLGHTITTFWSESQDRIFFGQGSNKREVNVEWKSTEEERARVDAAIIGFHEVVALLHGDDGRRGGSGAAELLV